MKKIICFYPGAGGNRYMRKIQGNDFAELGMSYDNRIDPKIKYRYLYFSTILEQNQYEHTDIILTHCLNTPLIAKIFKNSTIILIYSDLQKSLRREWFLHGLERYRSNANLKNQEKMFVEFYTCYKAPQWPEIESISEYKTLDKKIRHEVDCAFYQIENKTEKNKSKQDFFLDTVNEYALSSYSSIEWHLNYYKEVPLDTTKASKIINLKEPTCEFSEFMKTELVLYKSTLFDLAWDFCNKND